MEKCNEYLKELKDLYLDFDSLKDAPFMFFSLSASDLLHKIKMDVDNSYVNKSADAFSRYSKKIETKLGELPYDRAKDLTPEIEKSFLEYNYEINFDNYSIESILNLDPEEDLYNDLSAPINLLLHDDYYYSIYSLQNDFLIYCKVAVVQDIKNYLSEKLIESSTEKKNIEGLNWFKVGLLFATGEMDILLDKFSNNFTQIAKHKFGDKYKGYRSYISESYSNTNINNLNIYSDKIKLKGISDYCDENRIVMTENFKTLIDSITDS